MLAILCRVCVCVCVYIAVENCHVPEGGRSALSRHRPPPVGSSLNVHLERTPAMEALGEPTRLLVLHGQIEFARPLRLLDTHMLYIDLSRFVGQLHLNLTATRPHPEEDMLAIVEYHNIIVGQIILTEVGTFLGHRVVATLVGAAKQSCVVHILRIMVVWLATAQCHPKEVLRLVALVEYLWTWLSHLCVCPVFMVIE